MRIKVHWKLLAVTLAGLVLMGPYAFAESGG